MKTINKKIGAIVLATIIAASAFAGQTVYGTKTEHKYHVAGCQYLKHSKIAMTLAESKKRGLTPCSKCNPPK